MNNLETVQKFKHDYKNFLEGNRDIRWSIKVNSADLVEFFKKFEKLIKFEFPFLHRLMECEPSIKKMLQGSMNNTNPGIFEIDNLSISEKDNLILSILYEECEKSNKTKIDFTILPNKKLVKKAVNVGLLM